MNIPSKKEIKLYVSIIFFFLGIIFFSFLLFTEEGGG